MRFEIQLSCERNSTDSRSVRSLVFESATRLGGLLYLGIRQPKIDTELTIIVSDRYATSSADYADDGQQNFKDRGEILVMRSY